MWEDKQIQEDINPKIQFLFRYERKLNINQKNDNFFVIIKTVAQGPQIVEARHGAPINRGSTVAVN